MCWRGSGAKWLQLSWQPGVNFNNILQAVFCTKMLSTDLLYIYRLCLHIFGKRKLTKSCLYNVGDIDYRFPSTIAETVDQFMLEYLRREISEKCKYHRCERYQKKSFWNCNFYEKSFLSIIFCSCSMLQHTFCLSDGKW